MDQRQSQDCHVNPITKKRISNKKRREVTPYRDDQPSSEITSHSTFTRSDDRLKWDDQPSSERKTSSSTLVKSHDGLEWNDQLSPERKINSRTFTRSNDILESDGRSPIGEEARPLGMNQAYLTDERGLWRVSADGRPVQSSRDGSRNVSDLSEQSHPYSSS